jgi:hypothetical protein
MKCMFAMVYVLQAPRVPGVDAHHPPSDANVDDTLVYYTTQMESFRTHRIFMAYARSIRAEHGGIK